MNLLVGQLSFPQALGRDGPWPLVGSQDTSVSCSVINHNDNTMLQFMTEQHNDSCNKSFMFTIHLGNKMGQSGKISLGPAVTP